MAGLVKWGSYEVDAANKERDETKSDSTFMKLKVGKNVVRILPPRAGQNSPFKIVRQHFIRMPGNDSPAVFACPRSADEDMKDRCPACEQAAKLRGTGVRVDRDRAWELMPKLRVFANVIDRSSEESGPQVLGFGKMIFEELVNLREDEDAGGDYTHPTKGFDIIIQRQGTGKNDTSYSVRMARHASAITDDPDEMESWYESMENLDQFAAAKSYEEILEMLGVDGAPRRQRITADASPKRRKARKPKEEVIDVDVEEDDIPY